MSVYCIVNAQQKLHDRTRKIFLNEPLMYDNALAHSFRLALTEDDGTTPADLSGVGVVANFLRPDNGTVEITTGTITGNIVEVVLPAACYSSPGRYKLTVNLTEGSGDDVASRTALIVEGVTERNTSSTPIDPGTIMPSIATLEQEIEDAVATIPEDWSGLLADIAPTFSSGTAYSKGDIVWYDGDLYKFTSDHAAGSWTGADAASAVLVNDLSPAPVISGTTLVFN